MRIAHRTVMAGLFPVFVLFVGVCVAGGQEGAMLRKRFTNLDVIEMVKLGLSDDVILAKIRQAYEAGTDAVSFDTSIDGLKALKAANVPDSVIKVMINPAPPPAPVVVGSSPISVDPNDGDDSSDYVLIKLNKKSDHREFQIGSFGGITGGKSGVQKDKEIPFRAEHIGIRMYKITLLDDGLRPGEYAFFMGTGQSNTKAGARGGNRSGGSASGRVWDFTIPE